MVPVPVLIAFTAVAAPAHADETSQSAGSAPPQASVFTDCQLLRRAISRRACQARLLCEEKTIDITAETESKGMNHNF